MSSPSAPLSSPRNGLNWLEAFKAAANLIPSAIVIADMSVKGCPLIFVNGAFTKLTGFTREESERRNCKFLQGPETDPATVALLAKSIAEGKEVSCEILNYKKDGTPFRNFLSLKPVLWPEDWAGDASPLPPHSPHTSHTSRIAFYIGCQFEVTDSALVAQRLLQHEALLRMLPKQVVL